jgi:uncharacterized Zn finger protein
MIRLAEHALAQAVSATGSVDDSDGQLGEMAATLQDLHLKACLKARPDPSELATRLFDWELHGGDLDVFIDAAQTYAEVLGEQGLLTYRTLAEAAWASLPPLGPDDEGSYETTRFRITHLMQSLAEASGDVDAVVAVLARDLSSPYQFVRIANLLGEAARVTDALSWAERGLECFGAQADHRLVEVAADGYHRTSQSGRAVDLAWRVFDASPSPAAYRWLHAQATRAGSWQVWRPKALDRLRQEVAARIQAEGAQARSRGARPHWLPGIDGSSLVEVFLFEGDGERAWTEARTHGCSIQLWLDLARRREAAHPQDAIPIFQDQVERLIGQMNSKSYHETVQLMTHIGKLMRQMAQPDAVGPYVAAVRARHRPKRNLVTLLDARQW